MTDQPHLGRLYARALTAGLRRHHDRQSEIAPPQPVRREVTVDIGKLAAYNRVCGFRLGATLPPTYPHVLAFPQQLALMTDPTFPFSTAGLVHIRNAATVHRRLPLDRPLALTVSVGPVTAHSRGAQVELITEVCQDDEVAWTSTSTYLSRSAAAPGDKAVTRASPSDGATPPVFTAAMWRVPADIGRRYAKVSGDFNPIHLHPLTARLFGFPRAIAHGMWVKAHALAALEGRLPESYCVDVTFRKPLTIPGTVRFNAVPTDAGWDLSVWPGSGERAHLLGTVRPA
jgi:acyl dehydratase